MSICFLLPTPLPVRPEAEAYAQEIGALLRRFGGEIRCINPNRFLPRQLSVQIPRLFFGWHNLLLLRRSTRRCRICQLYSPTLYPYPVLRRLSRPVVYTLGGAVTAADAAELDVAFFNQLAAVTVADQGSLQQLQAAGLSRVHRVRSGVDISSFTITPIPLAEKLHLLMASAPWIRDQFADKGVDALLEAARRSPQLHLTFLWRGILTGDMHLRVARLGLEDRVAVIDETVDVNQVLAGVHATINLASRSDIVKAYPHSLLDSLAAGKPVLVSRAIPMAADIEQSGAGRVVEEVTAAAVLRAVEELRAGYDQAQRLAAACGREYSLERMLASYQQVYESIDGSFTGKEQVR